MCPGVHYTRISGDSTVIQQPKRFLIIVSLHVRASIQELPGIFSMKNNKNCQIKELLLQD